MPPIDVYRIGEVYFVKDGHLQRIGGARPRPRRHQRLRDEIVTEVGAEEASDHVARPAPEEPSAALPRARAAARQSAGPHRALGRVALRRAGGGSGGLGLPGRPKPGQLAGAARWLRPGSRRSMSRWWRCWKSRSSSVTARRPRLTCASPTCATCSAHARLDRRRDRGGSARPPRSRAATRTRWCAACWRAALVANAQDDGERIQPETAEAWGDWLEENRPRGRRLAGVMEEARRKGRPSLRGRRDRALRFGWMNSKGQHLTTTARCCGSHRAARAAPGPGRTRSGSRGSAASTGWRRPARRWSSRPRPTAAGAAWTRWRTCWCRRPGRRLRGAAGLAGAVGRLPPSAARHPRVDRTGQAWRPHAGPAGGGDRPAPGRRGERANQWRPKTWMRARLPW